MSGEVDILNGKDGGGIDNGCEVGGWNDSARESGEPAGDMVRP